MTTIVGGELAAVATPAMMPAGPSLLDDLLALPAELLDEICRQGGPSVYNVLLRLCWGLHGPLFALSRRLDMMIAFGWRVELKAAAAAGGQTMRWTYRGELHSIWCAAVETSLGARIWYKKGKRHRDDGPAYIDRYNIVWHRDGYITRDDGPARINIGVDQATLEWYTDDRRAIAITVGMQRAREWLGHDLLAGDAPTATAAT